jgi:hypothetical protein
MTPIQRHAWSIVYYIISNEWWNENAPGVMGKSVEDLIWNRIVYYFNHRETELLRTSPHYCQELLVEMKKVFFPNPKDLLEAASMII